MSSRTEKIKLMAPKGRLKIRSEVERITSKIGREYGKRYTYLSKQNDENSEILEKKMKANEFTTLDGQDPLMNVGGKVSN